jgi:hypothetical protein
MCLHRVRIKVVIQNTVFTRNWSKFFYHFPNYHMKIVLGDFNAKVGRELWREGYRPQIPVLSAPYPQLNLLNSPPPWYATVHNWLKIVTKCSASFLKLTADFAVGQTCASRLRYINSVWVSSDLNLVKVFAQSQTAVSVATSLLTAEQLFYLTTLGCHFYQLIHHSSTQLAIPMCSALMAGSYKLQSLDKVTSL